MDDGPCWLFSSKGASKLLQECQRIFACYCILAEPACLCPVQGKVKALAAAARLRAGAPGGGGALPELESQASCICLLHWGADVKRLGALLAIACLNSFAVNSSRQLRQAGHSRPA